jgi:hypothetical protein
MNRREAMQLKPGQWIKTEDGFRYEFVELDADLDLVVKHRSSKNGRTTVYRTMSELLKEEQGL